LLYHLRPCRRLRAMVKATMFKIDPVNFVGHLSNLVVLEILFLVI